MKKTVIMLILAILLAPLAAEAAWWKPSTWKAFQKAAISEETTTTTPDAPASLEPSVDDLKKRIVELEDKLEKALMAARQVDVLKELVKSAAAEPAKAAAPAAEISESAVRAKVMPAIVTVRTATTTTSGVIISAGGHVLTNASAVWLEDKNKHIVGAVAEVSIILSGGSRKSATLVGLDEATGIAVYRIAGGGSHPYLRLVHDSGAASGDAVFIAGSASAQSSGSDFAKGTVVKKSSASLEIVSERKPSDAGGAVVNASGAMIGIPGKPTCRVVEEGQTCLKYTTIVQVSKEKIAKVEQGMKLYKDKKSRTAEELLYRERFKGTHDRTEDNGTLSYAISSVTGKNSFDNFNSKLGTDTEGRIAKLYINKLISAAQNLYKAADSLKEQAYALRTFFINENIAAETFDPYQQKIVQEVAAYNAARLADYTKKVDYWSAKKNEYDSYLLRPEDATNDYLMEEGTIVEDMAEYLQAEKTKILEVYSGENVAIF